MNNRDHVWIVFYETQLNNSGRISVKALCKTKRDAQGFVTDIKETKEYKGN